MLPAFHARTATSLTDHGIPPALHPVPASNTADALRDRRVNQPDALGVTPLPKAAAQGQGAAVGALLAMDADPATTAGTTRAISAITKPSHARGAATTGAPAIQPAPTTLLEAVERNDGEALERMLVELWQSGKDVVQEVSAVGKLKSANDWIVQDKEVTPLMAAAYFGHGKLLALLLGVGATVDQTNSDGATALKSAAQNGTPPPCRRCSKPTPTANSRPKRALQR